MIGVVLATHGEFGNSLLSTLKTILGEPSGMVSVPLEAQESLEHFQKKVEGALDQVDPQRQGALLMVDLFGGTPFNVGVRLAQVRPLRLVTGLNLPMVIQAASRSEDGDLDGLAEGIQRTAREGIRTSMEFLKPLP